MTDNPTPPPAQEPPPFGSGIPAEAVEPVRLPPGLAHGPALDVRGHAAAPQPELQRSSQPASPVREQPVPQPAPPQYAPPPYAAPQSAPPPAGQPYTAPSYAAAPAASASPAPASAAQPGPAPTSTAAPSHAEQAPPAQPPPAAPPTAQAAAPAAKPPRRWWIAIAHLLFLVPFPPGVLITAAIWIWRRSRDPLMADQGREAINMQLTFWLAMGLLGATCLGGPLVPFVYVLGAVLCVLAAIAASGGDRHRYPWVFRFLT